MTSEMTYCNKRTKHQERYRVDKRWILLQRRRRRKVLCSCLSRVTAAQFSRPSQRWESTQRASDGSRSRRSLVYSRDLGVQLRSRSCQ